MRAVATIVAGKLSLAQPVPRFAGHKPSVVNRLKANIAPADQSLRGDRIRSVQAAVLKVVACPIGQEVAQFRIGCQQKRGRFAAANPASDPWSVTGDSLLAARFEMPRGGELACQASKFPQWLHAMEAAGAQVEKEHDRLAAVSIQRKLLAVGPPCPFAIMRQGAVRQFTGSLCT